MDEKFRISSTLKLEIGEYCLYDARYFELKRFILAGGAEEIIIKMEENEAERLLKILKKHFKEG